MMVDARFISICVRTKALACALACLGVCGLLNGAAAAPVAPRDPPFSSGRIARLPPAARREVLARCKGPEAGQYFATYDAHASLLRLDYSRLECADGRGFCSRSGCLHETFIGHRGRFILRGRPNGE
jgi:hypothetical protein